MSQSHEMRLLIADNSTGTTLPITLASQGCDLLGTPIFGTDPGRRGTRQDYSCGARLLGETVSGGFEFQPSATELDYILKRCMGDRIATFPATPLVPGETLPQFYVYVDKGPTNFRYDLCVYNRVQLSLREGDYLKVRCDLIGSAEASGVTWPTPTSIACASEYVCSDVTFTLGGTSFPFKNLTINIDNMIAGQQQENALYRTIFESEGLRITLDGTLGYRSDTTAFYRRAVAGDVGTLVFSDGTATYTWSFANLKIPGAGPTVPAQGEITQSPKMQAFRTAATDVVTVTKT